MSGWRRRLGGSSWLLLAALVACEPPEDLPAGRPPAPTPRTAAQQSACDLFASSVRPVLPRYQAVPPDQDETQWGGVVRSCTWRGDGRSVITYVEYTADLDKYGIPHPQGGLCLGTDAERMSPGPERQLAGGAVVRRHRSGVDVTGDGYCVTVAMPRGPDYALLERIARRWVSARPTPPPG